MILVLVAASIREKGANVSCVGFISCSQVHGRRPTGIRGLRQRFPALHKLPTARSNTIPPTINMDVPVNVPVDNPNEDTEWYRLQTSQMLHDAECYRNEILRKHGVIPEKPPSPTPVIEEALRDARQRAHEHRLEDKQLDELDELEDEEDEEFLNQYRYIMMLLPKRASI